MRRLRARMRENQHDRTHKTLSEELLLLKESTRSSREMIAQLQTQVDMLKGQNEALLDQTHYLQCQLDRHHHRTTFSHLPAEIRVMIWKLAADESPKIYKVGAQQTIQRADYLEFHFTIKCPRQPSVTQVCRESRAVLLPKRQKEIVPPHQGSESKQQTASNAAGIGIVWEGILTWFDPAKHAVLFPESFGLGTVWHGIELADILSTALGNLQERVGPLKHIILSGTHSYMTRNLFHICEYLDELDFIDICLEQGTVPRSCRTAVMALRGKPLPFTVDSQDIELLQGIQATISENHSRDQKATRQMEILFYCLRTIEYQFPLRISHLDGRWLLRSGNMEYDWQQFGERFPMAWATEPLAPVGQVTEFEVEPVERGERLSEEEVRWLEQEARGAPRVKRVVMFE